MSGVLHRSKLSISTHLKRSFVFASRLVLDDEICFFVKCELQDHLEKDITKFPMGIFWQCRPAVLEMYVAY